MNNKLILSSALSASLLFLLINSCLAISQPFKTDAYEYPLHSWSFWNFRGVRQADKPCDLLLLGSSLVVAATSHADANYLNKALDLTQYHQAFYLDDLLRSKYGEKTTTFSLAAPGQNPSDAYLNLLTLIERFQKPAVVVYGLAPRDFLDSSLMSPSDTEPFKYLSRLVNESDISGSAFFRNPFDKFDWYLKRRVYLLSISENFKQAIEAKLAGLMPETSRPDGKRFTFWDRVKLLPEYKRGELYPTAMMPCPITRADAKKNYEPKLAEYVDRYHKPDMANYVIQMEFLRKIAVLCKKENIELVVVNMPISRTNVQLLKPGLYNDYKDRLERACRSTETAYLDLCNFNSYEKFDFDDSVHLNAFGAQKFFDELSYQLAESRHVRVALADRGVQ